MRRTISKDRVRDSVLVYGQRVLSICGFPDRSNCSKKQIGIRFRCKPVSVCHSKQELFNINKVVCAESRLMSYRAFEVGVVQLLRFIVVAVGGTKHSVDPRAKEQF